MLHDLLSIETTARLLGRPARSVREAVKAGGFAIPIVKISARDRRFRRSDIEALLGRALTDADLLSGGNEK